ncbi:sugar phosphate isomerase/epimerase family protein [Modestobacter sp. VKM Ac-2984]|uniref:sugar phosphate isomerase/epimerase family protein n=1 Tax=Modestobacter sp. VKM Ac-2984 TaxID=3004138 RepID=UPI0022AA4034|nr:sugar phosphate isomerase/epimerase family protein [Modestobacter sp. VKM Ac-2984]MCZ2815546.1 sugar phosphate isomerase/epimerase [Modestobacter sp. VKM Ac-2984]
MTVTHGVHALVWTGSWTREEARRAIAATAEAGYDLIEIAPIDPTGFDADMTAELLQEHGLQVSASLGLSADTDVSSEDPDVVARGRARLAAALGVLRDSGGTTLCGVLYSKLGKYDAPATERGRANSQETIAWLADRAAASGITLALEFCNRYETNIINTTQETLDFIAVVDRPNVMAHLDTYHMNIEEHSFADAVRAAAAAGRLGYVHIGESHRGALGTGSIPWGEFFGALDEVGYEGIATFESFSSEVVHRTLSNDLAIWRNLWTDNHALARDALAFTKAGLAGAAAQRGGAG